jgi:deoxyinosine 3'endonuclease (endonuclease V)
LSKQIRLIRNFSIDKGAQNPIEFIENDYFCDKLLTKNRTTAGVDVSYTEQLAVGAVVALDYESLEV